MSNNPKNNDNILPKQLRLDFEAAVTLPSLLTADDIFHDVDEKLLNELHEDKRIERKSRIQPAVLGECFSMWANTAPEGGLIVVGMLDKKDGGGFIGCSALSPDELNQIEKCGHIFCPDARTDYKRVAVRNSRNESDFVIVIRVYYNESIAVRTQSGKAFRRLGDSKVEVKSDALRALQADKGEVRFEMEPSGLSWPDDFDLEAARDFANAVQTRRALGAHSVSETLELRRLGKSIPSRKFQPNVACALLFAKDPQAVSPGCKVRFQKFDGETEETGIRYNAVKDLIFEGTVPSLILQVAYCLETQLRSFSPLGVKGRFQPVPEYPQLAWYEAIVNACVHRSYGNGLRNMPIFVKMFNDRLEIESPGPFPPFVTPENIYDTHAPRNPVLMDAMFYLAYVKCAHEGTRRIRDTMKEMNLPEPEFLQKSAQHAYVKVILRNKIHERILSNQGGSPKLKEGGSAEKGGAKAGGSHSDDVYADLPEELKELLSLLGGKSNRVAMRKAILELCSWKPLLPNEISSYLKRKNVKSLVERHISPLYAEGLLERTIPETPSHPGQKYRTTPEGSQWLLMGD